MAHTGYICPVQDCRDAVYAVGFGYCVKHCIEFVSYVYLVDIELSLSILNHCVIDVMEENVFTWD